MGKWNKHQKYLETERDLLRAQLEGAEQVPIGDRGNHGSFSQTEEAAMAFSEIERRMANHGSLSRRLRDVQAALERLRLGTYGSCDCCGEPIPPERLDAMPQTSRCLKCKPGNRKPAEAGSN